MKLLDTRAQGSKTTLMHYIAKVIEDKYPDLIDWPDELSTMKDVPGAVQASQQDIGFLKGGSNTLNKDISNIGESEAMNKLRSFFQQTSEMVAKDLARVDEQDKSISADVIFFGETNSQDIPGFFSQWDRVAQGFKAAVKYNKAQAKKEAAQKVKEETKKKKEEEEQVMSKVVNTLRKSQANLKQMKGDDKIDGMFSGKGRRERKSAASDDVNSLVDDILSNNSSSSSSRPRRNMREDKGVVKQLNKGMRDSRSFSKIRESRGSEQEDKQEKEKSKAALQRQISTKLTRRR